MSRVLSPRTAYNQIAHLYDLDMGRNMPFDDIAFYVGVSRRCGGRTLELGCGNGRILLELLDHGIDAVGVDCSERMLEELCMKAAHRGLAARVCQMDACSLGFASQFDVVLCPYSLVTYITAPERLSRMFGEVSRVLRPGGRFVLDAFIPRPGITDDAFRPDYRRDYGEHILARSKRVAVSAPHIHRIERRYEILSKAGVVLEQIDTAEEIRPFRPEELMDLLTRHHFAAEQTCWDYRYAQPPAQAQFVTMVAHRTAE